MQVMQEHLPANPSPQGEGLTKAKTTGSFSPREKDRMRGEI